MIKYTIFDPTGNITALCEADPLLPDRLSAANKIMEEHPDVEQVGFVRMADSGEESDAVLEMAGGEFCGNASMCAAVWYAMERASENTDSVMLKVSGASAPVEVRLKGKDKNVFLADVHMPEAAGIVYKELEYDGIKAVVPVVQMEGISHAVIEQGSHFSQLLQNKESAGRAVRKWCGELQSSGLGLMFIDESSDGLILLTPLVYIPSSDTLFWEHSCASGSSAVCMYMKEREGRDISIDMVQPGGTLKVSSSPDGSGPWLSGCVRSA